MEMIPKSRAPGLPGSSVLGVLQTKIMRVNPRLGDCVLGLRGDTRVAEAFGVASVEMIPKSRAPGLPGSSVLGVLQTKIMRVNPRIGDCVLGLRGDTCSRGLRSGFCGDDPQEPSSRVASDSCCWGVVPTALFTPEAPSHGGRAGLRLAGVSHLSGSRC